MYKYLIHAAFLYGFCLTLLLGIAACDSNDFEFAVAELQTTGQGSVDYVYDSPTLTVTAVPDPLWMFDRWGGEISGTDNPVSVDIDASISIEAIFKPQPSVVAAYIVDKGSLDASEYANHGAAQGINPATDRFGDENGALRFDGENDRIIVQGSPELEIGASNSQYAVSLWLKSGVEKDARLLDKWNDLVGTPYPFSIRIDPTSLKLQAAIYSGSVVNRIDIDDAFDDRWHHLVLTVDMAVRVMRVYFDAQLVQELSITFDTPVSSTSELYIGASFGYNTDRYFEGLLDDIYILDRLLSAEEVTEIYKTSGWE